MAFLADLVKLRSPGLWSFFLAAAPLSLGGCILVDDDDRHRRDRDEVDVEPPPVDAAPRLVAIDTGAAISSEPGVGVGIFVEYAEGGSWKIWTTCDTDTSRVVCSFDLYASVDTSSKLLELGGSDLEGPDEALVVEEGIAHFHAETGSDIDVLTLATTPGAIVRLDAYLDGQAQPRFVYWFGDGVLHEGAPSNPVDFQPTAP
jgi:hypothetical protein